MYEVGVCRCRIVLVRSTYLEMDEVHATHVFRISLLLIHLSGPSVIFLRAAPSFKLLELVSSLRE